MEELTSQLRKKSVELTQFQTGTLTKFREQLRAKVAGRSKTEARDALNHVQQAEQITARAASALAAAATAAVKFSRTISGSAHETE